MSDQYSKWQTFWDKTSDPMHLSTDDVFLDRYGQELLLLVQNLPRGRVIELGCGNGALYKRLGFDQSEYWGYDYSTTMVDAFKTAFPQARVGVAALQDVTPEQQVDLIFSNGVIQYVSPQDLQQHLRRVRPFLSPGGSVVHGSIPWMPARTRYHGRRLLSKPNPPTLRNRAAAIAIYLGLKADPLCHWYEMDQLRDIGLAEGYEFEGHGCMTYPFRCHATYRVPRG